MENRSAAMREVVARLDPERARDAAKVVQEHRNLVSLEITPEESVERIDALVAASYPEQEPSLTLFESVLVYFMIYGVTALSVHAMCSRRGLSREAIDSFASLLADAWAMQRIIDVLLKDA